MEMSKNTDNNRNRVRHRLLPFLISSATDKRSKRSIGELKTPVKQKRWKISHSSPTVSRSLTGCFAVQNIGEVAHSDGRVNSTEMAGNIREIPARRMSQILQSPYTPPYIADLSRFVISQKRSSATPSHLTILPKRIKKPSDKNRTVEISIRFKY